MANNRCDVFLVKTSDRSMGVKTLLGKFDFSGFSGRHIAIKANFNSADAFPASTHIDTLRAIVETMKNANAANITLGERSGMGNTRQVLEKTGVLALSHEMEFNAVVLDEASKDEWVKISREGTHWLKGFYMAKLFCEADRVVQTCCLKTHRFGGHFTLSLKNSVGLVAKKVPGSLYDYMWELHGSPYQRHLIAEINKEYDADLIVMDGIKAFVDGGPESGKEVEPNLMLASKDRIAIDAVGVAILRSYCSTSHIMKGRIFDLEQIRRACELEIGVQSPTDIQITPLNEECQDCAREISDRLEKEG